MTTLHYIFDPLCGWCYAAAPLVDAARTVPNLDVAFHAGGMMAGPNRRTITADWREHVVPHDHRIAEMTGQPFGDAYFNGLLRDKTAVLDSEPPITAILAADDIDDSGFRMIHAVQQAHYVEGRRIADLDVLRDLASRIGLEIDEFNEAYKRLRGSATQEHISDARQLLGLVGGRGFPTFAIEDAQGSMTKVETGAWLGRPEEWAQALRQAVATSAA